MTNGGSETSPERVAALEAALERKQEEVAALRRQLAEARGQDGPPAPSTDDGESRAWRRYAFLTAGIGVGLGVSMALLRGDARWLLLAPAVPVLGWLARVRQGV